MAKSTSASYSYASFYRWAKKTAWELYQDALQIARVVYIYGPPGVGKSFLAQIAAQVRGGFKQVTLNEDLSVQELMGLFSPSASGLLWIDGPLTYAARHGEVLIVNEAARASQAVLDFLLGLIDSSESAAFTLPNGETVSPHANFRVVLSANTPPDQLDPALQSRLDCVIQVESPHPDLVARLNKIRPKLGDLVASSFADGSPINPRSAIAFGNLINSGWSLEAAAVVTFGNRAIDIAEALR